MIDVRVTGGELDQREIDEYITMATMKYPYGLVGLDIQLDGAYVDITYRLEPTPFSRIRRITGYLVGDMGQWNDGKQCEERDRVKHIKQAEEGSHGKSP